MNRKKPYHLRFTEYNGEQEYTHDELLYARNLSDAEAKCKNYLREWYSDGKDTESWEFEYFDGEILVRKVTICETTVKRFTRELLQKYTINPL